MKPFDYYAPTSLNEALGLLAEQGRRARALAGGTDLLLKMRAGRLAPGCLINIKRLPELRGLSYDETQGLRLGALTTVAEIMASPDVCSRYPALAHAAATMASVQIRNLATVGGNLCNAAPSADLAPPLIALGAQVHIAGPRGERSVALEEFFLGPGQPALADDELLVALTLPPPERGLTAVYLKHTPGDGHRHCGRGHRRYLKRWRVHFGSHRPGRSGAHTAGGAGSRGGVDARRWTSPLWAWPPPLP
jgi:CO/xanthine dehydrogenase FAD-binding subunit